MAEMRKFSIRTMAGDAVASEAPVKKRKIHGAGSDKQGSEVSVPSDATINDLRAKICESYPNMFFTLATQDGTVLEDDPTKPVPDSQDLTMIKENFQHLPAAAVAILEAAKVGTSTCNTSYLKEGRLGTCRKIGDFPSNQWKDDPRMPEFMEYHDYRRGQYEVFELTLIDKDGKHRSLIGVINEGDGDCNTGFWGPLYLRPDFTEIGSIVSSGDTSSTWEIQETQWYRPPDGLKIIRGMDLFGLGTDHPDVPALSRHLAYALKGASAEDVENLGGSDEEEDEEEDEE